MDVHVKIELGGTTPQPLAKGWVYLLQGGAVTTLHTDDSGKASKLKDDGNPSRPWEYTEPFVLTVGAQLDAYHSKGQTPIPVSVLTAAQTVFERITVPAATAQTATVSPTGPNTLAVTPLSTLKLTPRVLKVTTPNELELLPVTFTAFADNYLTVGLKQGADVFEDKKLAVTEDGAPTALTKEQRPRERAPLLKGSVDAAAKSVKIKVLNADGNPLKLLPDGKATKSEDEITATLAAPSGAEREFQAHLLFETPPTSFGAVRILLQADVAPKPQLEVAFFVLTGMQLGVVDDFEGSDDGTVAGSAKGEADDKVVVDFLISPQKDNLSVITPEEQAALDAAKVGKSADEKKKLDKAAKEVADKRAKDLNRKDLAKQARVRRMVQAFIRSRSRTLKDTTSVVMHPEMPMWMGELQLAGMTQPLAEELLLRRKHAAPPAADGAPPNKLFELSFDWKLDMAWDAPNSSADTRPFEYDAQFSGKVNMKLELGADDKLKSVTDGAATEAFNPAPEVIPFPVEKRRLPRVRFNQERPWGRKADAAKVSSTLVEFQPDIRVAEGTKKKEVMRGGDADFSLSELNFNAVAVNLGDDPKDAAFVAATKKTLTIPTLRVCGTTPSATDIKALLDALVQEFFDANSTKARVTFLPLARWQTTVRLIVEHESGNDPGLQQFETRGAGRRTFGLPAFGHEQHMPLFGAPAGFGIGQLDNPPVTVDQMWSYVEELRASVKLIMDSKAKIAFDLVNPHTAEVGDDMAKAVYQREIVRRYNGNTEFRFKDGKFEIFPTGSDSDRLKYPNKVLGTTVVYKGFSTAVEFTEANFGP